MRRLLFALLLVSAPVYADAISDKLDRYEQEARVLGTDMPQPNQRTKAPGEHKLVDAEVAYSLGDYDGAALALFDLVDKQQGADKEAATYYLAEALYQKGDLGTAREYYKQLATGSGMYGKYRVQSLQRIIEIAIAQRDDSNDTAAALGALQSTTGVPSVPYVLGKYAFAQGNYDNALSLFAAVQKGSDYELQSDYFTGATYVAKKDLAKATDVYTQLIDRKPRTLGDRRVIELAQMALGRIYYEREQPAKSIDAYLLVDRHSDLFSDALYEVSWVYVKSKQFDKALRALELLQQSDPNSTKTPTVRILEGNLRIRKAQMLRQSQIAGTINNEDKADPASEYDKAAQIFAQTHDQFAGAYTAMAQVVDGKLDPATFIDQVAGRSEHVFQLSPPVPEAAAQMLRDEPDVQVFDAVEGDLSEISANIQASEDIIARLDAIIASGDRTAIYPNLAARRSRIAAMQDDLIQIRSQLADQQNSGSAESAQRKALVQQYIMAGAPEQAYALRLTTSQEGYDALDQQAIEISGAIDSSQAIAVSLRKWETEAQPPLALSGDKKDHLETELNAAAKEAQAIEDELAATRREISLGKDLAGLGDQQLVAARGQRAQVRAAEDAESRSLSAGGRVSPALDRAARLAFQLDGIDQQIDRTIAQGLEQIKAQLVQERQALASYKAELAEHEKGAHELGSTVLGQSFKNVKTKLDDIVTRTDVGSVDVAWSQKEDVDDDVKRLNLAHSRELKQLKDEFKDILVDTAPKPVTRKSDLPPPPSPEGGKVDTRVNPGGGTTTTAPTVKPDEPKKGGNK
jgi:TolA-binding protein